MANPVGWFEVTGPDAAALQGFYSDAFGWKIDASNPMNYGMVAPEEGGIGGGDGPNLQGLETGRTPLGSPSPMGAARAAASPSRVSIRRSSPKEAWP